jgi:predicted ATPase
MLLKRMTLNNVLSFKDTTVELGPLNVLIGPNASGKSNLIEAVSLLKAAPRDLRAAILRGGGVRSWIWLGDPIPSPVASLNCQITESPRPALHYFLEFSEESRGFVILRERLQTDDGGKTFFDRSGAHVDFNGSAATPGADGHGSVAISDSVLSSFRSPVDPTPITQIGREFEKIRIYREFNTGPTSQSRSGISASVNADGLDESGDNLALVLQDLNFRGLLETVVRYLQRLSDRFEDVKVKLDAGIAQTYLQESGLLEPLPAVRMSDGTLKFLCLVAALLHPNPSRLTCIEEPEIGLHPEAIQIVAQVLVEASQRTQLIVTTHSEALVDAMSDTPESVLVCERDFDNSTQFKRLRRSELDVWSERYSLGELWRKGEIGGTRW